MDVLKPGHAHRSSSDRLLNNYLDSQKSLSTSLLTLLSHSHSSTSSLLAYVTSSPGVLISVRRAVRHAAFEGPLSSAMMEGDEHSHLQVDEGGWAAYISSLDQFRKDLKEIHKLEEEMSRVKRDREILVGRLIKATKGRPTKNDISALATSYSAHLDSSAASVFSDGSSMTSKEGKRTSKLADAQAELLGCEEHLRSLEVRIENERNRVMSRGLEERFRSMEVVGRMWVQQAKRGLEDLDRMHDLPPDAFELDSNASLAPSQSASQVAYEDHPGRPPSRGGVPFPRHFEPGGSVAGSIAEVDEGGSSSEDNTERFVVHENRPTSRSAPHPPPKANSLEPHGVSSVNTRARPLSDANSQRAGNRRAASDVGTGGYRPPSSRAQAASLRRTYSHDHASPRRAGSDTSSIREHRPKKKGFFASISKLFKTKKTGSQRSASPAYGQSRNGGWQTRTDTNIKRGGGYSRPSGDSSSSEDEGNFVSVSNNQNSSWSVDNVGRQSRNSGALPVASGLIPPRPTRSASQSTITAKPRPKSSTGGTLSRSGTVRSMASDTTAKSSGTAKKKTRPNGSIARANVTNGHATPKQGAGVAGQNLMTLVNSGPVMPDVPRAPQSGNNPTMASVRAPGSSIVPHDAAMPAPRPSHATPAPATSGTSALTRSVSTKSNKSAMKKKKAEGGKTSSSPLRPTTPLPPSRTLSPPLKSAMRPISPQPVSPLVEPVKPLYTISAPPPISLEDVKREQELEREEIRPQVNKRNSYVSVQSDGASVYESAVEDDEDERPGPYGPDDSDSSDEEEAEGDKFKIIKNEQIMRRAEISGDPRYGREGQDEEVIGSDVTVNAKAEPGQGSTSEVPPSAGESEVTVRRRKSVRMAVPDSPITEVAPPIVTPHQQHRSPAAISVNNTPRSRSPSPEPKRVEQMWSTRIGRTRDDTSDEEDADPSYLKARRSLKRNSGKWDAVEEARAKANSLKKRGSVKSSSKGSVKSKGSRLSRA